MSQSIPQIVSLGRVTVNIAYETDDKAVYRILLFSLFVSCCLVPDMLKTIVLLLSFTTDALKIYSIVLSK